MSTSLLNAKHVIHHVKRVLTKLPIV